MTVSLVLNNHDTGRVSPQTRDRVLQAVRELEYRPPATASEAVQTIGIVTILSVASLFSDQYVGRLVEGAFAIKEASRLNSLFFAHHLFVDKDIFKSIRIFCDGRCDGLIVIAPYRNDALVPALLQRGTPFVVIGASDITVEATSDNAPDATSCDVVDIDNAATGRAATEYLLNQGHRRIGFVGGNHRVSSVVQRWQGYRDAFTMRGIAVDPRLDRNEIARAEFTADVIGEVMRLPSAERPTALFCWNGGAAETALDCLPKMGFAVPADVSVIAIDDWREAPALTPALTTFRQPIAEIGAHAMRLLLNRLAARTAVTPAPMPVRELLPAELIVRASVGPASG